MAIGEQQARFLKQLKRCGSVTKRNKLLVEGGRTLQKALREIAFNLLKGNVRLTKTQLARLKRHREAVRLLAWKKTPLKTRLRVEQRGGFLPALITPILASLAGSVITSVLRR